jgi:hypothetical protein
MITHSPGSPQLPWRSGSGPAGPRLGEGTGRQKPRDVAAGAWEREAVSAARWRAGRYPTGAAAIAAAARGATRTAPAYSLPSATGTI